MDYEKKYKEIVGKIRKAYLYAQTDSTKAILEEIFPELKESEDEKIRRELLESFKYQQRESRADKEWLNGIKLSEVVAWLEKQTNAKVKDFSENREDLSEFYKQVCRMAALLLNKEYDYTMETIEWCAYTLLKYAKKELEKQGEQPQGKSAVEAAKEEKIDNANKVEPKFKVGDWCIDNEDGTIFQIVKVLDNTYTYKTNEGKEYSCTHYSLENDAKLWTIQDARDGDVLYSLDSNRPFIFKERNRYAQATAYCGLNIYGRFFVWDTKDCVITLSNYVPATKEQYDLLFAKMKEAGYTWDAEKKELKKVEQKPTWSAEDEKCLENAIMYCEWARDKAPDVPCYETSENSIKWLKSLKNRVQPKQEWSEEDEERVKNILSVLDVQMCWDGATGKKRSKPSR